MRATRCFLPFAIATIIAFSSGTVRAIELSNVLVLYNSASTDGEAIASYFRDAHPAAVGTSGVQLVGLNNIGTAEEITADDYLRVDAQNPGLRQQVMSAIAASPTPIDLIVTTKGLPLRINVTEAQPTPQPGHMFAQYVDSGGTTRDISMWRNFSSLESELTSIDTVSMWQMMGDQSYTQSSSFVLNPYYQSNSSFSHAAQGTRLTARLDGFTVSDVTDAIDRAQNAFIGPSNSPGGPFHFLVDNDPSRPAVTKMAMTNLVNNLNQAGLPVTYDNTWAFAGTSSGPLMGYVSHGANQGDTPNHYIANSLNVSLADGAVFHTWESYNAYSMNEGGNIGEQALIGEWLQKGGTAATGHVEEPGGNLMKVTNEDHMFAMLLVGKTWAEAVWSSTRQMSYVNTLIGDPLMTWKTLEYGDINMDGFVDMSDLSIMGSHWGNHVASGGYGWGAGDINSDGVVDFGDLALMGAHWGEASSWATGTANMGNLATMRLGPAMQPFLHATPEPSTMSLLLAGSAALLACGRRWKRQRAAQPAR